MPVGELAGEAAGALRVQERQRRPHRRGGLFRFIAEQVYPCEGDEIERPQPYPGGVSQHEDAPKVFGGVPSLAPIVTGKLAVATADRACKFGVVKAAQPARLIA